MQSPESVSKSNINQELDKHRQEIGKSEQETQSQENKRADNSSTDKELYTYIDNYEGPMSNSDLELIKQSIEQKYQGKSDEADGLNKRVEILKVETEFREYKEQTELKQMEKQQLVTAWQEAILGKQVAVPENLDQMENEELRSWLDQTLSARVDGVLSEIIDNPRDKEVFAKTGELKIDTKIKTELQDIISGRAGNLEELTKQIEAETDPTQKAKLEIAYLRVAKQIFDKIKDNFARGLGEVPNEASLPRLMAQNQEFLCLGATALGEALLKRGNIGKERYWGEAMGHALNIVRLSDETWYCVDFNNSIVTPVEAKGQTDEVGMPIKRLANVPDLEIDNPLINYRHIALHPTKDMPAIFLGLGGLENGANLPEDTDWPQKLEKIKKQLGFQERGSVLAELTKEGEGDSINQKVNAKIGEILGEFSSDDDKRKIEQELKINQLQIQADADKIRDFILGSAEIDLQQLEVSEELKKVLDAFRDGLSDQKTPDRDFKIKVADSIMAIMKSKAE